MSRSILLLRNVARHRIANYSAIGISTFSNRSEDQRSWGWKAPVSAVAVFGSVLVGAALSEKTNKKQKNVTKNSENVLIEAGGQRPDLPTYRADEVSKHDSESSFWVTYKHGVYDITKFLSSHPGGDQILNAAGLSIEPFWNVYGMHKTDEIYKLLESYRIGNLHADDVVEGSGDELWAREPRRHPQLVVRTARPFNAEIPPALQVAHFDTPNELFYVRQHMPVPELDAKTHRVRVVVRAGARERSREFSLADLDKFPRHKVRAALMCAGNRRSEMDKVKPVKGISWAGGAISNAVWEGVYLRDVLRHIGVDLHDTAGKHVILTGADVDATGENFSTSIPLHMLTGADIDATGENFSTSIPLHMVGDVLLATTMNGQPLPPDHGRPLRAVVPGAPAVRSVKWLESITISEKESSSHWHQKDYRSFNASTTWETADFARAPPLYSLPVTSAVCAPLDGATVELTTRYRSFNVSTTWETADFARAPPLYSLPVTSAVCAPLDGATVELVNGRVQVQGYAYSGGGASIVRVDVSCDGGRSWVEATLQRDPTPPPHHYAWALWTAAIQPIDTQTEMEIWVKATDSNFNTQPESFDHIWNIRGLLSNAYHKIKVHIDRK